MVDHFRIDSDRVHITSFDPRGPLTGPVHDDHTIRIILQQMQLDGVLQKLRTGDPVFIKCIFATMTSNEQAVIEQVWTAILGEMTPEQSAKYLAALDHGIDRWIADIILLKFIRAHAHPALVRGSISAIARSVESLAGKATRIAKEIASLSKALEHETSEGMNFAAFEANLFADAAVDDIGDLQKALSELAAKRDAVFGLGRRANSARRRFAREWIALWHSVGLMVDSDDGEILENTLAGAIEAIEGEIGTGQREWVSPLIAAALLPDEVSDETSK